MTITITKVQYHRHASGATATITGHGPTTNFEMGLLAPQHPGLLAGHLREEALQERAKAHRHTTRAARLEAAIAHLENQK